MRLTLFSFLALLPCLAADGIGLEEYKDRRARLRKAAPDGVFILFGNTEKERGDMRSPFFQEAHFYYLTGWKEPGAILVVTPTTEAFFLPRRSQEKERWTGAKLHPESESVRAATGFDTVTAAESFEAQLPKWAEAGATLYMLAGHEPAEAIKRLLPLRTFADASRPIGKLRMVKSRSEIALLQRSTDATVEAHRAAWRRIQAGLYEYQIASTMMSAYFEQGCERHAYPPIVGSGPNSTVLHYSRNSRRMDSGEVLLMDVGGECSMYAADITRTTPVNGKFTPRQRELYDVVLGAQKAAIAAVKPGAMLGRNAPNGLYKIARDYLDKHGKDKDGEGLGKYFTHGLGHHVGLDVHDSDDPTMPLAAGMVITIEPGVYIPAEGIGIRIEDMVLVTENGSKVLSESLPREAADIERALRR